MADIYRHEFYDTYTGHRVRLDIAQASTTVLSGTPVVVTLAGGVIKAMNEFGWEHKDNIPFGMPSPGTGKIIIKASICPAELMDWLTDGITSVSADMYVGALDTYTLTFDTGTTFQLFIKPAGGAQWSLVGNYVQDVNQVVVPDPEKDEIEINIGDALQHACKAITFTGESIDTINNPGLDVADFDKVSSGVFGALVFANTAVVEWTWKASSKWWYIAHIPPGAEADNDPASCFWSVPIASIASMWNDCVRIVLRAIMRRATNISIAGAIINAFDGLYKQNYETNALVGAVVPTSDLRWILFATDDNNIAATTEVAFSMHDVLKAYDNLWDFLYDLPRSRFKTWHIRHTETSPYYSGIRFYDPKASPQATVDITSQLKNPSVKLREDVVARVEVSTEFQLGGDYTSELNKAPSSRNNDTFELPVTFDSSPVIDSYVLASTLEGIPFFTSTDQFVRDRLQNRYSVSLGNCDVQGNTSVGAIGNPRFLGIYYAENPTDGALGNAFYVSSLLRCHAWQPFVVDGETPTPPTSSELVLPSTLGSVGAETINTISQQIEGTLTQLSRKVYNTFYGRNTVTIEAEVGLDCGAVLDLTGSESQWLPFVPLIRTFEVNPARLAPYLAACPSIYHVVACRYDFSTGKMKITLWGN